MATVSPDITKEFRTRLFKVRMRDGYTPYPNKALLEAEMDPMYQPDDDAFVYTSISPMLVVDVIDKGLFIEFKGLDDIAKILQIIVGYEEYLNQFPPDHPEATLHKQLCHKAVQELSVILNRAHYTPSTPHLVSLVNILERFEQYQHVQGD